MDPDELARIKSALVAAIAEGRAVANEIGVGTQLREIVRHAREMHDLLVEAMLANEPLSTAHLRGLSDTTENAIE